MQKLYTLVFGLIAVMGFWACEFTDKPVGEDKHYVSLLVEDSLTHFDSVQVTLRTTSGDSLAQIWHGKLTSPSVLTNVEVDNYDGGNADIYIIAIKDGKI